MTTGNKTLTGIDFMMMDIHRQLDEEDVHPETLLDKSARPQQEEHSDEESVGVSHARCEFCFGPLPCTDHPNVEPLDNITRLNLNPTHVLAQAHGAGLKNVVVVGEMENGDEYFASSVADGALSMYLLQRGIYKLHQIIDGGGKHEDDGKTSA